MSETADHDGAKQAFTISEMRTEHPMSLPERTTNRWETLRRVNRSTSLGGGDVVTLTRQ